MSDNIIMARCVTTLDDINTSHIQGFSCKPEVGERVTVLKNGKDILLEICGITHKAENTLNGYVPYLEVELTLPKPKIL